MSNILYALLADITGVYPLGYSLGQAEKLCDKKHSKSMQINGNIVAFNVAQLHQRNLANEYCGEMRLKALIIFLHVFLEVPLKINIRLCLIINYRVTEQ